jgi:hypothetical protein
MSSKKEKAELARLEAEKKKQSETTPSKPAAKKEVEEEEVRPSVIRDMTEWNSFLMTFEEELNQDISILNVEEFKFIGMNPAELATVLLKQERSTEQFARDMSVLIVACTIRGVNMKMTDRMSDDGKARISKIIGKYGIVAHKKDVPMTTPTLPRILALFPREIYNFRKSKSIEPLGNVPAGLDKALCYPGGGAMIKSQDVLEKWLAWYESFCKIVRIKYDRQQAEIPFRFTHVPEDQRF